MNRVKYTEWIDAYVDNELDPAGKAEFEAALKSDGDLALEYSMEQDMEKILMDADLLDFRAKCIIAQNEQKNSTKRLAGMIQLTRKYWYAAASVILIAFIAGALLLLHPGEYSGEKLFKLYYKSGETIGISRTGSVNVAEALLYFGRRDYLKADKLFEQILVNDPGNYAVMYYAGISNIELKNFPRAIQMFEIILQDNNNLYTELAEWYLGLSYLAMEETEQAASIIENIANLPGHLYAQEAASLTGKLVKSGKNKKILNNLFFLILPF